MNRKNWEDDSTFMSTALFLTPEGHGVPLYPEAYGLKPGEHVPKERLDSMRRRYDWLMARIREGKSYEQIIAELRAGGDKPPTNETPA